jgi:cell wall-associated NlpC family hydrolase
MTISSLNSALCRALIAAVLALGGPAAASDLSVGALGAVGEGEPPRTRLQNFTDRASELVMRAMGMIGIRYKYGGDNPDQGLDCSGLVRHVFRESFGLNLPRTSEEISKVGERIETTELQPGDLVFYNTLRRGFSHVGIYLGDKKFIHAPSSGGEVRIESMDVGYWKKRFNGARRINDPQQQ